MKKNQFTKKDVFIHLDPDKSLEQNIDNMFGESFDLLVFRFFYFFIKEIEKTSKMDGGYTEKGVSDIPQLIAESPFLSPGYTEKGVSDIASQCIKCAVMVINRDIEPLGLLAIIGRLRNENSLFDFPKFKHDESNDYYLSLFYEMGLYQHLIKA